ncbi:hypothetical protein [Edaphosphingomonas haloaromaticamans]|nr:hypothetical protein [Sphingomonas haloaromaticamans]
MTKLTTPVTIGPMVAALIRQLGGEPMRVPVVPQAGCEHGECFAGVSRLVGKTGGEMVTGWCIWERPRAWAEAEHHAVWRREDGSLIDPTPKPDGETEILFVPDASALWAGPGHNGLPTVRRPNQLNRNAITWVEMADQADALIRPYRIPGVFGIPANVMEQLRVLAEKQKKAEARLQAKGL